MWPLPSCVDSWWLTDLSRPDARPGPGAQPDPLTRLWAAGRGNFDYLTAPDVWRQPPSTASTRAWRRSVIPRSRAAEAPRSYSAMLGCSDLAVTASPGLWRRPAR